MIGVSGTAPDENKAFIYMSAHFREKGLPVPQVFIQSDDCRFYLQEDLGDTLLFDAIEKGRKSCVFDEEEKRLLHKTIRLLPTIQFVGADGFDFSQCYPQAEFNQRSILWDLNYFKYCFLKATGMEFQEDRLEDDFQKMADVLLRNSSATFMYRDFQSRNIMVPENGELRFIDFQGGRMGPVHYDLASFIWQARARYSPELKQELTEAYLEAQSHFEAVNRRNFLSELRHFILFRTLQVLGAYGFRGLYERRPHFLESIPYAMDNLRELLSAPFDEYPCLCRLLGQLIPLYSHREPREDGRLLVRIFSFSYKNGIPEDSSGNGGGYVFDCRGLPNPGRLPEYRCLTGLDVPVIEYLQGYSETGDFARDTAALADRHIDNYLERGFTDLMFCFGCTGGRHRSVYFAERLAEHLAGRYADRSDTIQIRLVHREQNLERQML